MNIEKLREIAEKSMRESIALRGGWETHAVLYADKSMLYFDMVARDDAHKHQMQAQVSMMIRLARSAGLFEGLIFGSEAWLANRSPEHINIPLLPRNDPDRVEGLVFNCFTEKERLFRCYKMERDGNKVSVGERMLDEGKFESWLDAAFVKIPSFVRQPVFKTMSAKLFRDGLKLATKMSEEDANGQSRAN